MIRPNLNRSSYIRELLSVSTGDKPADLIVKGGNLVNVHTAEIHEADIAIKRKRIAAVGDLSRIRKSKKTKFVDAKGKYLVPGLIDPHLHTYHAHQNITQISRLFLAHGTTAIADSLYGPGQISLEALRFFIEEYQKTPIKLIWLIPIVSYLQNRVNGLDKIFETFNYADVIRMLDWEICYGLEEPDATLMVEDAPDDMLRIYEAALEKGMVVTGHAWNLSALDLNHYVALGSSSDHEGETRNDAMDRARLGMWVQIRHGSGAIATPEMVKAITENKLDSRRFCFCADLIDTLTLKEKGNIDDAIRVAIRSGINPITAVQMGSLNAAESIGVNSEIGSVAPGKFADILLVDNLPDFTISTVIANGQVVARDGECVLDLKSPVYPRFLYNTVRLSRKVAASDFHIKAPSIKNGIAVRVIEVHEGTLHMPEGRAILPVKSGNIRAMLKTIYSKLFCWRVSRDPAT